MKISVLGTGCYKCRALDALLVEAIAESGRSDVSLERIDDEREIRRYMPLESIPGLLIDGRLVSSATVPSRDLLREWLAIPETNATRSTAC